MGSFVRNGRTYAYPRKTIGVNMKDKDFDKLKDLLKFADMGVETFLIGAINTEAQRLFGAAWQPVQKYSTLEKKG